MSPCVYRSWLTAVRTEISCNKPKRQKRMQRVEEPKRPALEGYHGALHCELASKTNNTTKTRVWLSERLHLRYYDWFNLSENLVSGLVSTLIQQMLRKKNNLEILKTHNCERKV